MFSVSLQDEDQQFSQVSEEKVLIKKRAEKWTVDDVCQWITELGLDQYEPTFRTHQIDGQELIHLDDNTLHKSLGIGKAEALVHICKLLCKKLNYFGQVMTKGTLWLSFKKSSQCCLCKVPSLMSLSWKIEAVILNFDKYREVWSDLCNPVWNVTSWRTLNLLLLQSAGLQLLGVYFWHSINI